VLVTHTTFLSPDLTATVARHQGGSNGRPSCSLRRIVEADVGVVLTFLPALIAFLRCYIQISSRQMVKKRNGKQEEARLLRALTANGFEHSSIYESSVMDS